MTGATKPGGQKSDNAWLHIPLSAGEKPWCLEWPEPYAQSARITLVLTTEHPELLEQPTWAQHIHALLNSSAATAQQTGNLDQLSWLHAVLDLHACEPTGALSRLLNDWNTHLPAPLLQQLARTRRRGQGRRLSPQTLRDHDAVERLSHANQETTTTDARIVTVAEQHTGGQNTGYVDRTGAYAVVKKHHQRVRARAVQLPYLLLPCEFHASTDTITPIPAPNPAWLDLPLPALKDLETARTITFRPRVLLPEGERPPITLRGGATWESPPLK